MPAALPDGDPAPLNGVLPPPARVRIGAQPFGIYVHVPYCTTRCGYCDFNTYTAAELGGGASRQDYPRTVIDEVRLARRVLGPVRVQTVFFGGGTPTLLPAADLVAILRAIDSEFGLADGAEVTTEANPESVDPGYLAELRVGGFTRMSFGMQSAVPQVLAVLDRVHSPGRPAQCVRWAHDAGFEHVNLDLIYGTPGESDDGWRRSVDAAIAAEPDHVSAYALIVEDGTRLASRIRRGELPMPDDDVLADRYLLADELLGRAGFGWYEVSNWATSAAARCRHNLLYWTGGDWWGAGPGAHSHVGGTRWWNVKHPAAYADRLADGHSPALAREVLDDEARRLERILLGVRIDAGHPLSDLRPGGLAAAGRAVESGLLTADGYRDGRAVLTLRGRLLADAVVRDLTD
ncbi:MAG: radical SAM family heme chaperone HemW [Actinomycetes bacterium]